jgi:hypothetical protein
VTIRLADSDPDPDTDSAQLPERRHRPWSPVHLTNAQTVVLVAALGGFLRIWRLRALGLNSDEAVYAGQAASIAGEAAYLPYFPIFRAHPLIYQGLLSLFYQFGVSEVAGRLLSAAFGVGTLLVVYATGSLLYNRRTGLVAMLLLAVMPYHVVVTRQVLLDGTMVFFATTALYLTARYCKGLGERWLIAAGGVLGLAILTKETAVVLVGGIYCFFMLCHSIKVRLRLAGLALGLAAALSLLFPLCLQLAGASRSGGNYLAYQLFRRANHPASFYLTAVPTTLGVVVLAVITLGLILDRRSLDWREGLLLSWAVVPVVFFTLMPIKGFQYLLPLAPVAAVLAARCLTSAALATRLLRRAPQWRTKLSLVLVLLTALSLAVPAWSAVQPSTSTRFLAGSGGLPGGREAGRWIDANVPQGATFLTVGPSMANVIAFYGHRQAYGISVSPNPLNRNPSYTPIENVDLQLRSGTIQYAVWDSFSAQRSPAFSERLLGYVRKYNGVALHTETVPVAGPGGLDLQQPVITVYEIRP